MTHDGEVGPLNACLGEPLEVIEMSNKANHSLTKAVEELTRARDEVKVGLHLLSMDAKEKWKGLESRLLEIDDELRAKGEAMGDTSAEKVHEVAKTVREFIEKNVKTIGGERH